MKQVHIFLLAFLIFSFQSRGHNTHKLLEKINQFISTLNDQELRKISYDFNDSLRTKWSNLPAGIVHHPGLKYGDLNERSKISFHEILLEVFSSQGYLKTNGIMDLDDYLVKIYEEAYVQNNIDTKEIEVLKDLDWGRDNFYISLWGDFKENVNSTLKFEGHHISLNLTMSNGEISITPFFLGAAPALVRSGNLSGRRLMSKEEDYALDLIQMLSNEQKQKAVFSNEFPKDILTAPGQPQRLTTNEGISAIDLNQIQKNQLFKLIEEYLSNFESEKADFYLEKIQGEGINTMFFGWIGGTTRHSNHYYVINGPDFLIEYDNAGWIYKGDHIHTIFRDKRNDFGEDILKSHYKKHKHR